MIAHRCSDDISQISNGTLSWDAAYDPMPQIQLPCVSQENIYSIVLII